jgi:hypothetical protein
LLAAALPNPHRRDPRAPSPELRRLGGIYQGRVAAHPALDACIRPGRPLASPVRFLYKPGFRTHPAF